MKGVHERNKSYNRCQLQTLGEASRTHTCFALIHVHTKQKQTPFTVCEVTALLLADSCPCVKKGLAFIIFMENMTWATRHVNNLCRNGHFERSQVYTPCAPYPFAHARAALSRAQSVLLIVSPFNHHWQRKRAVAGAKWCDERRGEAAGREGGVKEKDEGDDILKLAGCAKVTDDLMLVVTLLCHRNQVICQTPLSSPPLSSRFHRFSPVSFFSSCFISCRKISKLLSLLDFTLANGFGWKNETVQPAFSLIWRSKGEI